MINNPPWYDNTPCKGQDRLFFSSELKDRSQAKTICKNECSFSGQCLKMAVENELTIGVWGGKTGPEIARMVNAA